MDHKTIALQTINRWIAQMSESEQRRMIWGSVMAKDELVEQLTQAIATALTHREREVWEQVADEVANKNCAHSPICRYRCLHELAARFRRRAEHADATS